jgi:AMMECR1 domain-containing protein
LGKYACISAFQDDRFDPIEKLEVAELQVGVSLLVDFTPIPHPLSWEVGKHGIEIDFEVSGHDYGGTFLPEVAHE